MVSFAHVLTPESAEDVRAYLIERANVTLQQQQAAQAARQNRPAN
jgi:hypothetical protein